MIFVKGKVFLFSALAFQVLVYLAVLAISSTETIISAGDEICFMSERVSICRTWRQEEMNYE